MRRFWVLAILLALFLGNTSGATARVDMGGGARPPKVTGLSAVAGPLTPSRIKVRGRDLQHVVSVTFGKQKATGIRQLSAKAVSVLTPRRTEAGSVIVRVRTKVGTSAKTQKASYTFLDAPQVARLSPASGQFDGGTTVRLTGSGFVKGATVRVGAGSATDVKVLSPTRLSFVTGPGVPGDSATVIVSSAGGTSARSGPDFTYLAPADADSVQATPHEGTFVPTAVTWVTGGADPYGDDPTGAIEPWQVHLPAGVATPSVDEGFYLPPGGDAYPSGLAGRVTEVATQGDGGVTVSVAPDGLGDVFDDLAIDYAGDLPSSSEENRAGRRDVTASVDFSAIRASAFLCKDQEGQEASFNGSVGVRLEHVNTSFELDLGGLFRDPYVSAWVAADVVIFGNVTASGKLSCDIRPSWLNAHRKVFPLGASGATISFGPTANFTISGQGTFDIEHRSRHMVGFETTSTGQLRAINSSGDRGLTASAAASFSVSLSAGVSVQIGALDRIGIFGKLQAVASGTATASGPPPQVCLDLRLSLKASVGAYLDVWIARWDYDAFEHVIDLARFRRCLDPATPEGSDTAPVITSSRLPNAVQGESYEQRLTTADDRGGSWSVISGRLPSGLTLDGAQGVIYGTATGVVRTYSFTVQFRDSNGQIDSAPVALAVVPPTQLGGGSVQVTLRWGNGADLDLHLYDPTGQHIWYGDPGPTPEGGELDHDANPGCNNQTSTPAENVLWPTGAAPGGGYTAYVVVYDDCSESDLAWSMVVRVNGNVVLTTNGIGNSAPVTFSVGSGRSGRPHTRPTEGTPKS